MDLRAHHTASRSIPAHSTVSRIVAHSPSLEMDLSLDIASELYPLAKDQQFTFLLASSLHSHGGRPTRTGAEGEGEQDEVSLAAEKDAWRLDGPGGGGLADEYDYVMYGKVSKCFHDGGLSLQTCSILSRQLPTKVSYMRAELEQRIHPAIEDLAACEHL